MLNRKVWSELLGNIAYLSGGLGSSLYGGIPTNLQTGVQPFWVTNQLVFD